MSRLKVALLGAAGYTGAELIRLIDLHPELELVYVGARENAGQTLGNVIPALQGVRGLSDLVLEAFDEGDAASLRGRVDVAFTALPHAASARLGGALYDAGIQVLDLSADFRLRDLGTYETWYGPHPRPDLLPKAVYGLPELYAKELEGARLIACPGCYPTSAILPLVPLLRAGLVTLDHPIIVDSKSGVSGAGRTPKANLHYPEANENFSAYGVGSHRHTPEIDQVLSDFGGKATEVVFTPHLVPMDRGILTTTYSTPTKAVDAATVLAELRKFYANEPFVRVVDGLPTTKDVVGTNYCDLTARVVRGRVVTISVIDNLIKGAAGAAVQNFNLMYGFDETTAL
jgi:N-acetyl-gamma-glutamyl-phosphate reductase